MRGMEHDPVAVQTVKDIPADGRRWLEGVLGAPLQDHQQVFLMAFSPSREPDDESRRRARAGLEMTFAKTEAYAREHGILEPEIDDAFQEAMRHVRSGTD